MRLYDMLSELDSLLDRGADPDPFYFITVPQTTRWNHRSNVKELSASTRANISPCLPVR
jgi:hypothetical protein